MKKLIITLFILLSVFSFANTEGSIDYVAKVLADENGNILDGENIDTLHPLASVTKLMTVLIALEKIKQGELKYDDLVTISYKASVVGGSSTKFKRREKVKVEELLKSIIVYSGNDAAIALAEHIGRTEERFVRLMNRKASELGMKNTSFNTSTGLPTNMTGLEMDISTAEDIIKLSIEALKYDKYLELSSLEFVEINDKKFRNRNKMIGIYEGMDGLKTGHHSKAKYNITVTAKRNDLRLMCVYLGGKDEKYRDLEVEKYLDYGFNEFERIKLGSKGELVMTTPIKEAISKKIELVLEENLFLVINKKDKNKVRKTAVISPELTAPLKQGEKIGVLSIEYKGKIVSEIGLLNKEKIEKIPLIRKILRVVTFNLL